MPLSQKKKKKKKTKTRLPNKIIPLGNADKDGWHEKWKTGRNPLNVIHPWRCVCMGPPNTGKTTVVKNLIIRAEPAFEEIFVIHCDPDYTHEYDDVGATMLSEIPQPEEWEGAVKTLVVLDDLEFKMMSKDQKRALDRLFGFVSTHKNISLILCSQDPFNVPPSVRRCANLWILWKIDDLDSLACCARKTGLKKENFSTIFRELMTGPKDSLWLDKTDNSPYPMRRNGFEMIERKSLDNDKCK